MDHELGECEVEARVLEGDVLGSRLVRLDPGISLPHRLEKRRGGVDGSYRPLTEDRNQAAGQRPRATTDVEGPLPPRRPDEGKELVGEGFGEPAHEPSVSVGTDIEGHGWTVQPRPIIRPGQPARVAARLMPRSGRRPSRLFIGCACSRIRLV